MAQDKAGNQAKAALSTNLKAGQYMTSSINIDDSFIKKVIVPLLNEDDTVDPEYAFKQANEDWREDQVDMGAMEPWEEAFMMGWDEAM